MLFTDQQVRSDLEECPKWVLYKLKESIHVKQSIEKEWEVAKQDLTRCKQELVKQFQTAMQRSEEKKAELEVTQRELLQKKLELEQKEFDIQVWKDSSGKYAAQELKLAEEKYEETQTRVKLMEEEIDNLAKEIAHKDVLIQRLQLQISELKSNAELDAENFLLLEQDNCKLEESEAENKRLIKEVERLESELELRISQSDYESAFEEVELENEELKKTLQEQAVRLQEQHALAQKLQKERKETERERKESDAPPKQDNRTLEELRKAESKVQQLEEELALQRLTEMELKEIMEGIDKEAKRLSDEVWLKDSEIGRLKEEKDRLRLDLERAQRNAQKAAAGGIEEKIRAGSVSNNAPKPVDVSPDFQKKGGGSPLEDEELLSVIALGKRESWRPNIKAKSCKLAWLDANAKMDVLARILLKDDMSLVGGIRAVVEAEDEAGVAMALIHLFVANNKESALLRYFVRKDVQQTEQFSDVFKSNSLTSKILSGYSSLVGEDYLQAALKPILVEIISQNQSFELEQGTKCATSDLADTIRKLLLTLRNSLSICPLQLYTLSGIMWHEVGKKFTDEERYRALAIWMFARFFAPAIFSPPDSFELGEINTESKRGLVLITRVLQHVAHGNPLKEKKFADINAFSNEFWSSMKYFADIIKKGVDGNISASTVKPKMTTGEALKTLVYVMGSKKIALINSLKQVNPVTDTYQFKTAERLISACVNVGVPQPGRKLSIKENDSAVEDFSNIIMEKPRILAELSPISLKMNEGDKLAQSLVIICHCRNRDEVIPEFIKEFLLRDMNSNPKDPKYQHDGMASRTFLPYSNLIAADFATKMLTPLLLYCNDIKDELKPNSPSLMEALAKFTQQIVQFIPLLPFAIWDICSFIHTKGRIKGPSLVASFLFMRFFCPAIKNPEAYCYLPQVPTPKIKKNVGIISEALAKAVSTSVSSPTQNSTTTDPLSQLMKAEKERVFHAIENWLIKPTAVPPTKVGDAPFPWSIHEEAIRYLHQLVFDNISTIAYKLGEDTASSTMTYQMGEIVDVIVATLG